MPKKTASYVRRMPKIYGNLQKPKRSFGWLIKWLRNLTWIFVVVAGIYAIWFSGWFQVQNVQVQGSVFSSAPEIKALVPPKTNIWLLSKDRLTTQVLRQPSVEGVSVLRGIPDSIRIVVQERKPALLWISGNDSYVLDPQGYAFATFSRVGLPDVSTPQGAALAAIPKIYDVKAVPVKVTNQVASPLFVSFIQTIQKQMATDLPNLTIDHFEISDTTYDVSMYTKQGLTVQFNSLGDAAGQVKNLALLINQNKVNPATSAVDLRVDRWAYVIP